MESMVPLTGINETHWSLNYEVVVIPIILSYFSVNFEKIEEVQRLQKSQFLRGVAGVHRHIRGGDSGGRDCAARMTRRNTIAR